ncbi:MAG: hypothetical protein NVS3B20_12690 [Polyangiales bacterium]
MTTGAAPAHETAAIRSDIEDTRRDMTKTIGQIEERLSPAHLKEQMADLKESALGQYHDAKDHVKDDLSRELESARAKVQEEVRAAKIAVQQELHHARMAVREATVGKVEHMVKDARHAVSDAGTSILDTIKENPIPSAMLAIGLGWLLMNRNSAGSTGSRNALRGARGHDGDFGYSGRYGAEFDTRGYYGNVGTSHEENLLQRGQRAVGEALHSATQGVSTVGHRAQEGASHLADKAQMAMHDVGDSVGSLAHRAAEGAEHFAHDARETSLRAWHRAEIGVHRVEAGFETALRENPLAVGAVALAIGAAVGLSLPHTAKEDEWMGGTKDRLFERAEEAAHDALQKVEGKVDELAGSQKGSAKRPPTSGQSNDRSSNPHAV